MSEVRPFRQELKFLVHHSVKRQLLERWRRYLVRAPFTNEHAQTPILSQYYDSPMLHFYLEKTDGIDVRNKVRLRVYGNAYRAGMTAFLEIKHRYFDRVKKYRHKLADFGPHHLDPATWSVSHPEMHNELQTLRERYRLRPSAQVYYQREAYEGAVESDVRVTFDSNLMGLFPGERLTGALMIDRSRMLMPDTVTILEVKATDGMPGWVSEGVVAMELTQGTIPKYVTAVEVLDMPRMYGSGVYV
jgi:hypothetical protein